MSSIELRGMTWKEQCIKYRKYFLLATYSLVAMYILTIPDSTYAYLYLVLTINWSFGFLPLPFCCLMVPLSLVAGRNMSYKDSFVGFGALNTFEVAIAAIYHYAIKSSGLTKRIAINVLLHCNCNLHNLLLIYLFLISILSTFIPDYFVVFLFLSLHHSLFEMLRLYDKRVYLGTDRKDKKDTIKKFEKAFLMSLAMVTTMSSSVTLNNSAGGLLFINMLPMHQVHWYLISISVFFTTILFAWVISMVIFLGFAFTKYCLKDNIRAFKDLIHFKDSSEDEFTLQFRKSLTTAKHDFSDYTFEEVVTCFNLLGLTLTAIWRRPFFSIGWSDVLIKKFALTGTKIINEEISFSFASSIFVIMFFLNSNKKRQERGISTYDSQYSHDNNTVALSSYQVFNWEQACLSIPWKCLFCIGASNNLLYGYFLSETHSYLPSYFAMYNLNTNPYFIKLQLFFMALFLNIFNFNHNVIKMMQPFVLLAARAKNEGVSSYLIYAVMGSTSSFMGIVSNIPIFLIFYQCENIKRRYILLVGLPFTIVQAFFRLFFLWIFSDRFNEDFNLRILENPIYKPFEDWMYDNNYYKNHTHI